MFCFVLNFSHSNRETKFAFWKAQGYAGEQRTLSPLSQRICQWIWKSYQDAHVELIHSPQTGKFLCRLIYAGWKTTVVLY